MKLKAEPHRVADWQEFPLGKDELVLWWLGQAGFALRFGNTSFLIDPYLSDSLAAKYKGTKFAHTRMMPTPVAPEQVTGVDWVFVSHAHTDHMDPVTLAAIASGNNCRFVGPAHDLSLAKERIGVTAKRLVPVNPGDRLELTPDICVSVIPSAHESIQLDERGRHRFIGFIFRLGDMTVYHPGDCVPYSGLQDTLAAAEVDLALMPVNGRDAYRASNGIPGNFTAAEALDLCAALEVPFIIPHHFGMFDFNTIDVEDLRHEIDVRGLQARTAIPALDMAYKPSKKCWGSFDQFYAAVPSGRSRRPLKRPPTG